jgi:hypothetical protein
MERGLSPERLTSWSLVGTTTRTARVTTKSLPAHSIGDPMLLMMCGGAITSSARLFIPRLPLATTPSA